MFKFATLTFSYSTFFGDDAHLILCECFFGGRYNNIEIGASKCFLLLAERIERWCNDIFCSTR